MRKARDSRGWLRRWGPVAGEVGTGCFRAAGDLWRLRGLRLLWTASLLLGIAGWLLLGIASLIERNYWWVPHAVWWGAGLTAWLLGLCAAASGLASAAAASALSFGVWVHAFGWRMERAMRESSGAERFLCPHCLRFGRPRYACRECQHEVIPTGAGIPRWALGRKECRQCSQPALDALARCVHCGQTCERRIYDGRRIAVIGVLFPEDVGALCGLTSPWEVDPLGVRYATGARDNELVCALDLSRLPEPHEPLPKEHALRNMDAVWLGRADAHPLAIGQAADRLARVLGTRKSASIPVMVCGSGLSQGTRDVLEARLGEILLGCEPAGDSTLLRLPEPMPAGEDASAVARENRQAQRTR